MTVETANQPIEQRVISVLPLRGMVVFPGMVVPLFLGRELSKRAVDAAMADDMMILFLTQRAEDDVPTSEGLFGVGTVARLLQSSELPDGALKVLAECVGRAQILNYFERSEYHEAKIQVIEGRAGQDSQAPALRRSLLAKFEEYVEIQKTITPHAVDAVRRLADIGRIADSVASHIAGEIAGKQAILETISVPERIEKIISLLDKQLVAVRRPPAKDSRHNY